MEHAEQVRVGRRLLAHIENGTTDCLPGVYRNPVEAYGSDEVLRREKAVLFREFPLLMALSCELRQPGDYRTEDHSGVPILLVRARDGQAKAYLNVCRHRGAKVAEGCGRRNLFTCPYHAWSYDTDGRLVRIPTEHGFADIDRAELALTPLPVCEKYGMIWVKPAPGADFDIDAYLGGLGPELASYHAESFHHYETRIVERPLNWKLACDGFLEGYHVGPLHRTTIAPILQGDHLLFDVYGRNQRLIMSRANIGRLKSQPEAEWNVLRHLVAIYQLFPNTMFVWQGDHLEINRMFPLGNRADASVMIMSLYVPEPPATKQAVRHWDANMDILWRTVCGEDLPVGESIQKGLFSGAQDAVVYGRNEPGLQHFHEMVRVAAGLRSAPAEAAE